ncbi:MAG: DNA mismatch repair protein MutS [Alphaproteobacteria bacterium]|nr:DNA mismatch repair protein MutS [Alphaproteobacteria bacterium]
MRGPGRKLRPEEEALWRKVAERLDVRHALPDAPAPLAASPNAQRPRPSTQTQSPGVRAAAPRPSAPADRGPEKRVRRGRVDVAAALDLHGFTAHAAQRAVTAFLRAQQADGARVVLIVTGKGRTSADGAREIGTLKRGLPEWLAHRDLHGVVAGYAQAHAKHGGGGAFYVFLKRAEDAR